MEFLGLERERNLFFLALSKGQKKIVNTTLSKS